MTETQLFCAKVQIAPTGCWLWMAYRTPLGYGKLVTSRKPRRSITAYRYAYERFIGPVPKGHHLHHKCENPPCCNPEHLEPLKPGAHCRVSPRWPGNWTHCKRGHPLEGDNLVPSMLPVRTCRTCWNLRAKASAARRRADPERWAKRCAYDREWKRKNT